MKKYSKINIGAEKNANTIFKSIGDPFPTLLLLIRWTEKHYNLKIKIIYTGFKKGHRGLAYKDPADNIWKIFINSNEAECGQRFTVCHEIAHIILNTNAAYSFSANDIYSAWGEERYCNRFTAAFLMPAGEFICKWNTFSNKDILKKARIANYFKVSGDAVYYRAKELKLI